MGPIGLMGLIGLMGPCLNIYIGLIGLIRFTSLSLINATVTPRTDRMAEEDFLGKNLADAEFGTHLAFIRVSAAREGGGQKEST